MTNCTVLDWQGNEAGESSIDLKTAKDSSAADLLHRAVLRQQAHSRQGTASTLTRSEVRGGGRKPYKQKGTGRARQGSVRTPLRPGGGIIFGLKTRKYNVVMNRKERRLALRTALMSRISEEKIIKETIVEIGANNENIEKIILEGKKMENDSNQILDFTKKVKDLDENNKIKIIESLWKIIYSNKESDIYEDNLMRRLAGLLYIDSKIMGDIKEKIKGESFK